MKLSDLGEFAFIERLAPTLKRYPSTDDIVVGIGDDAAVWRFGGEYLIATTDTMIAGVHFLPDRAPWWDVGWKALAVNVSDIAAMGGWPSFALVSLAAPPDTELQAIDDLYEGLQTCARISASTIIGGDTVKAREMAITVTVLGRAELSESGDPLLLLRDKAVVGDVIAVTGPLGNAAAGLQRLLDGVDTDDPLVGAHLRPRPRLAAGVTAVQLGVACGMDISDGLLQDLGHICRASTVGAVVRAGAVPLSDALREASPDDALRLACTGGEDYELLLVGPEVRIRETLGTAEMEHAAIVGEIVKDSYDRKARVVDENGRDIRFPRPGWDAFKS